MSGTLNTSLDDSVSLSGDNGPTSAAPGGGGSGGSSVGVSTSGVTAPPPSTSVDGLDVLPPQYSNSDDLGFFTRQNESVPTAVTTGPDGALYISELGGIPYPEGFARIVRVADPTSTTGFDGKIPSGVAQTYASGFSEIQSLGFAPDGTLFVLEYANASAIYDPTQPVETLPPSKLIRVGTDGVRTTISGAELKLGNYLLVDKPTGDVFVAINNASQNNGEVLRYHTDAATGATSFTVVASGLDNPRGLSFGPDGNLYVLESGRGADRSDPGFDDAPVIPFIPGLVGERGGYTGSITKVELDADGGQERVFTGLPSFREFYETTGEDRVISIGPNGFTIAPDGTAYVASGGGLAPATAAAVGPLSELVRGVVRVDGLFDGNPADANLTAGFDSLAYASQSGPDGSTTLFNTQTNLNDITLGADGNLYAVDAARNVMYGIDLDGTTLESVTVIQKRPPVLTPAQFGAVVSAGGNPAADYAVENHQVTYKNELGLPDTPGRAATPELPASAPGDFTTSLYLEGSAPPADGMAAITATIPPRGEDASLGAIGSGVPGDFSGLPPAGFPGQPVSSLIPGPIDPTSPPVFPGNIYSPYFDPFFGYNDSGPLNISNGQGGTYAVSNLYSFGDRLADDGGAFGEAAVWQSLGLDTPFDAVPYNPAGNFTDGLKWTNYLGQILGVDVATGDDNNFAFQSATARVINDAADPAQSTFSFSGQIDQFLATGGYFLPTDLVTVTFGGNDITLPTDLNPYENAALSIGAMIDGMYELAGAGAEHFLVTNLPDITIAPLFSDPAFQALLGDPAGYAPLIQGFNDFLELSVEHFRQDTGLDVTVLDLNALFAGIVDNASDYGFVNVDEPILINPPVPGSDPIYNPAIIGQDPAVQHATLFLDPFFDPTALAQSIMAETARSALL